MSVQIQPVSISNTQTPKKKEKKEEVQKQNKKTSPTVILSLLTAGGIVAAAILAIKNKKKPSISSEIKRITGKNPLVENLTAEEKEKLIRELQTKTDNPEVKAEIRKLIENGEWDKL